MDEQKSIPEMLQEIAETMCDGYCKWPNEYLSRFKDPEDANEVMLEEKCGSCPMGRLMI